MPDDWTSIPYGHVKDWTPVPPDPSTFESKPGILDWIFGSGEPKNDIRGLATKQRLDNVSPQIEMRGVGPDFRSIPNQSSIAPTLKKAATIGQDPSPMRAFARNHPYVAQAAEMATGYPFANPDTESGSADLLSQIGGLATHGLSKIAEAGLPFMILNEGKPVFHGAYRDFEKFDPSKYDTGDILGWMTHAASNPNYADQYATGEAKNYVAAKSGKPRIFALQSEAQNVLDLVNPNADDIGHALAAMDPYQRKEYIEMWKQAVREPDFVKRTELRRSHYPDPSKVPNEEVAARYVADRMHLSPEQFDKTPFDAIKYRDLGNESWAFPSGTKLKSHYSDVPMTAEVNPIKVIKAPESAPRSTGSLELAPSKSKVKSIKDVPLDMEHDYPDTSDAIASAKTMPLDEDIDPANFDYYVPDDNPWDKFNFKTEDYIGKKVHVKLGDQEFTDWVTKENHGDLKYVLDHGGTFTPVTFSPTIKKTDAWEKQKAASKLQAQLKEDYHNYPGLKEAIDSDLASKNIVNMGIHQKYPMQETMEIVQNYMDHHKNQLINKDYSSWAASDMGNFVEKYGINPEKFKNTKELEDAAIQIPVSVPGYGHLSYDDAKHLLPSHLLEKYFW